MMQVWFGFAGGGGIAKNLKAACYANAAIKRLPAGS